MTTTRTQFSAKFAADVKYLRHKNGIVYPFNPALENDPNFSVVVFRKPVSIIQKPPGYIPPSEELPEEQAAPKKQEPAELSNSDLSGSIENAQINPPSVAKPTDKVLAEGAALSLKGEAKIPDVPNVSLGSFESE